MNNEDQIFDDLEPKFKIIVSYKERVDKYIADNSNLSRSDIKKLIENHAVVVNQIIVRKPNFTVKENDEIFVMSIIEKEIKAIPENIPLNIIYEDDDIVVINKPSGMVVHPAPGHHSGTLVNALLYHFQNLSNISEKIRPGIVHRIDKDTSGLLVVAKNNESHQFLSDELKNHNIKRIYYAWVEGVIDNQIVHINLPIGRDDNYRQKMSVKKNHSKSAITHVYVEKVLNNKTFVRCELETGRTHQIRVHLAYIKHPIIGDPIYGHRIDDFGQRLHAAKLELIHPTSKKIMIFEAPFPKIFDEGI